MIDLAVLFALVLAALIASTFVLGFRLGSEGWRDEYTRFRLDAAQAERQLHAATVEAFFKMAEAVERRRRA